MKDLFEKIILITGGANGIGKETAIKLSDNNTVIVIDNDKLGCSLLNKEHKNKLNQNNKLYKLGIFTMIAIIIHNIPEGIATYISSETNIKLGIAITIAIAMHNIPEGISIAMPVYYATKNKKKAIGLTFLSGMSEPLGAVIAFLFLNPIINNTIMGGLFAIIAGIMTYISIIELLPAALQYKEKKKTIISFLFGIIFMYVNHMLS